MNVTLPGLFDLQVNGFGGVDFNAPDLTADRLDDALEQMRRTGVTRCLPTLITSSFDRFAASARLLSHSSHPAIAGIHMEGPYVSPDDGYRGAHPRANVATPTLDDFRRRQDAAAGRIVLVTLAPERPGALRLIEHLVDAGIRVALGHTAATAPQIADAITAGATLATHLGNGCPQLLPRHPNVIWDLLAADALAASIIADGHHLPPATVKSLIRAKGARRTILVTDAIAAAACATRAATRDRRRRVRSRRRRTGVVAGNAVPRRLQPDDGPRHRQRGEVHGTADSTTSCRWRQRFRRLPGHDDRRHHHRRLGRRRVRSCESASVGRSA